MFTWNLLFVSKKRLEDTLNQMIVGDGEDRDVLVRIHTAIHTARRRWTWPRSSRKFSMPKSNSWFPGLLIACHRDA